MGRMKISVIIPVKGQTEVLLQNLKDKVIPYFDSRKGITYDVLIAPNGSSEEEQKALLEGVKGLPAQVKVLPFIPYGAKGLAVKNAILSSSCDYDLFFDADLATDLSAFELIEPELGHYDAFIADRDMKGSVQNKRPFKRWLGHVGSKALVKLRFHLHGIDDTQCGYKCFRDSVAKEMARRQIIEAFAFDVEYCYFLSLNRFKVKRIPVRWFNDERGSTVSFASASKKFSKDLSAIKKNKAAYILTPEDKDALC